MAKPNNLSSGNELTPYEGDKGFNYSDFNDPSFLKAVVFVLVIVTLSLIFYVFNLHSQLSARDTDIEQQEVHISELRQDLAAKENMLSVLESSDLLIVPLSGMEANENGSGKIFVGDDQALLHASQLKTTPKGYEYQLWAISDERPSAKGLFSVSEDDIPYYHHFEPFSLSDTTNIEAFAISLEPSGGSTSPSGEWFLWGNLNSN